MARDLEGQVYLITGSNTGIGKVTAQEIANRGAHVILACRSQDKAQAAIDEIKATCGHDLVDFLKLDLADLDQVRASAQEFLDRGLALNVLINNAGLAGQQGQTKQGFELHFGVNHLGPFLFTMLLMERLQESGTPESPARIVNVASRAHTRVKNIDYEAMQRATKTVTGFPEYSVSKLANVYFTAELKRRIKSQPIITTSLHPGVVASDIWRRVPQPFRWLMTLNMITNEQGAQTSIHCATSPQIIKDDAIYYDKSAPKKPNPVTADEQAAQTLWQKSLEWTQAPDWPRS